MSPSRTPNVLPAAPAAAEEGIYSQPSDALRVIDPRSPMPYTHPSGYKRTPLPPACPPPGVVAAPAPSPPPVPVQRVGPAAVIPPATIAAPAAVVPPPVNLLTSFEQVRQPTAAPAASAPAPAPAQQPSPQQRRMPLKALNSGSGAAGISKPGAKTPSKLR